MRIGSWDGGCCEDSTEEEGEEKMDGIGTKREEIGTNRETETEKAG